MAWTKGGQSHKGLDLQEGGDYNLLKFEKSELKDSERGVILQVRYVCKDRLPPQEKKISSIVINQEKGKCISREIMLQNYARRKNRGFPPHRKKRTSSACIKGGAAAFGGKRGRRGEAVFYTFVLQREGEKRTGAARKTVFCRERKMRYLPQEHGGALSRRLGKAVRAKKGEWPTWLEKKTSSIGSER